MHHGVFYMDVSRLARRCCFALEYDPPFASNYDPPFWLKKGSSRCQIFPRLLSVYVSRAVFKTIAVVSSFDYMAMMGEPIKQSRRHLRVAEHRAPFRKAQVGCDDDACALIELADQMEKQ